MPIRLVAVAALFCALLFAAVACGDDDGGDSTPTPDEETSEPTATEPGETPADGDEKTPGSDETPDGEETPSASGTPATPAAEGTPAVAPDDQADFLQQFAGQTVDFQTCVFDPATLITDCGDRGEYAVDPPLGGQDISCQIGLIEDEPVYINCMSQVPLQSIYYEIQ